MNETYLFLNEITARWGFIQDENASHRHLVTQREWENWEAYDKSTVKDLIAVLKDYDANGGTLSAESARKLELLGNAINSVKHLSFDELEERNGKNNATELMANFKN
jgi:hypothetical protein